MVVVVSLVLGAILAGLIWRAMAPAFSHEIFIRQNYRDRDLPTAVGAVIPLVVVAVAGGLQVAWAAGADVDEVWIEGLARALMLALGFAFLGLLDDLGGTGESGGFRGHLRALARGRLTTGAVKLFGGAALALAVVPPRLDTSGTWSGSLPGLLVDGAVVALAANLANLFDRAPGRVVKVSVLAFVALLLAVGLDPALGGVALAVGAGLGLLLPDLREHLMLGDAGANVLGAVLGLGVVLTTSAGARAGVLVVLVLLNVLSEVVSFSKVIQSVAPLRAADRLGRVP